MKNSYLTMIVFTIFTISFCSKTQAQKQSRVERLYQHIAWSEGDKYDRLRERMDTKSMDAYKNEITLADALRQLLLTPGINAIEPYLKSDMTIQQQDGGARLRSFCQAANLNVNLFRHKADSTIFALLVYSKDQLEDSRTVLAQIKEYDYNIDPDIYEAIVRLKEKVQYADLKAQPTQVKCDTYFKDFHNQYNYVEVAKIYNDLLYKAALDKQNDSTILCYFNDTTLKTFYANSKEPRPYLTEVQKLYDDCLFKAIQTATSPEVQKHCINAYIECPYLAGCNRRYLPQVEYANDSIDLVILVSQVDSFPRLPQIKTYLQTHKYKQFRDKAQQLRKQFIDSITYISPTITRYYSGTNIARETRIHNDSLTITTYQYSPQGLLTRIIQSTRLQKDSTTTTPLNLIVTTFRYNDLGKCYEEETIDSLAKATVCLINYQYDTISRPVSFAALQCRVPPVSSISAPSARRPERCRSMGRGPNSQPPGLVRLASPHRARIAPRKITEDRISRISASGTSQPVIPAVSTSNTSPRHPALQPKACRIRMDASTSRRRGQRRSTTLPPVRMVAARMGSTLFFAPCMVTSPWRRFPPRISSRLILLVPPDENGITGHSMGKEQLRFLPPLYQKG